MTACVNVKLRLILENSFPTTSQVKQVFATRCRHLAACSFFHKEKFQEKPLGPGYSKAAVKDNHGTYTSMSMAT